MRFLSAIADLFMPRICLCCGAELEPDEEHLCRSCFADLPLTRFWKLRESPMAGEFNALIQKNMGEDVRYQPFGYGAALFFYKGGYKEITKSLKYRRNFKAGAYFAGMLGERLKESELFRDVDLVVPIPLHWTRRWSRGYNQAGIIAEEVARELDAPCEPRFLNRARRTRTQTRLGAEGRSRNVEGAFKVSSGRREAGHILLIDDVFTTGATAVACERALRAAFPKARISVATLACVEN